MAAVAKAFTARVALGEGAGPARGEDSGGEGKPRKLVLETRTSLHRPYQFNHGQVRRIWAYVTRDKKAKTGLRKILGRDLGKDLDAAYRNAYLCVAVEHDALEVSLRMHPDAWYDGQNFKNRAQREGLRSLLSLLNTLDGFKLKLADWRGDWTLGTLSIDRLEEFMKAWIPGEHLLAVERRWPAPEGSRAPATSPEVPGLLVEELLRLVPLYRWAAWSTESDFLGLG